MHSNTADMASHNHSYSNPALISRLRGALYGLAVGDALGGPYEFKQRGSYKVSGEMEVSHNFFHKGKPLRPGTWTDDTRCAADCC